MAKKTSESMSMKGHSFKTWLVKNKAKVKGIITATLSLISAVVSGLEAPWAVAVAGIVALLSTKGLDTLDFYLSDVVLE